jgi:hypothetical protein
LRRLLLTALLAAALPVAALAQRSQDRRGFWLAGGLGVGHTTADCDQCAIGNREGGSYLSVALGGTVRRNVLVGVELNAWYRGFEDGDESLLGGFTVVQWYPWHRLGLHLRTGVGWSYARSGYQVDLAASKADKLGLGLRFGAGWDVRVAPMISITPFLGIHVAALGDRDFRGGTLTNLISSSRQAGVGVTIH